MTSRGVAVLTRDDIAAYAAPLAAIGLATVALPVTRYTSDPAAIEAALDADPTGFVMIASPRAAAAYLSIDPAILAKQQVEVWAIGDASAQPLRAAGIEVIVPVPPPADAAELAAAFLRRNTPVAYAWVRVLVPRAAGGRDVAIAKLRAAGASVLDVIAYRTDPIPPAERDAAAVAALDDPRAIVCVFAPSQVTALARTDLARYAAIGRTTAAALAAAGVPRDRIATAATPTPAGLADAIQTVYLQGR